MKMNDKQIIRLLFERNEKALSIADDSYGRLCRKISFEILHNEQDAEECVNTAYVKLWNSIPPKNPESLKGYLCAIVRNTALDTYSGTRSGFNACYDELSDNAADSLTVESAVESKEISKAVNSFIKTQKKINADIFVSRYYFGMSFEAIASELNLSASAVEKRLSRLRKELRIYLNERGITI